MRTTGLGRGGGRGEKETGIEREGGEGEGSLIATTATAFSSAPPQQSTSLESFPLWEKEKEEGINGRFTAKFGRRRPTGCLKRKIKGPSPNFSLLKLILLSSRRQSMLNFSQEDASNLKEKQLHRGRTK